MSDNLILGVGQDADAEGRPLGTQISLFDVSDFANPLRVQNYTVADAFSQAEWDHKAFRFLTESKILIIPLQVPSWRRNPQEGFDGFRLFSVDENEGIEPYFSIEHERNFAGCWSRSILNGRSLVFRGTIWTAKGHSILKHDLTDRAFEAKINLDDNKVDDCFPYWLGSPVIN